MELPRGTAFGAGKMAGIKRMWPPQLRFLDLGSISYIELKRPARMWTVVELERLRRPFGDTAFVGIGQERSCGVMTSLLESGRPVLS
jgi:hypothetical protein